MLIFGHFGFLDKAFEKNAIEQENELGVESGKTSITRYICFAN